MPAEFFRRSHSEHTEAGEAVNHVAGDLAFPIDRGWIKVLVKKATQLF